MIKGHPSPSTPEGAEGSVPLPSNRSYEDFVREDDTAPFNLSDEEIQREWER